jgi:hypothetical protein
MIPEMKTYLAATEIIDRHDFTILALANKIGSQHDTIVTGIMNGEANVDFKICDLSHII